MTDWTSYLCLGGICFSPVFFFALGLAVGRGALPWIVRIERREDIEDDDADAYAVEVLENE